MMPGLKARWTEINTRFIVAYHGGPVQRFLASVLLPFRRPFLFLAELFAELGILFDRLSLLSVKAEGYFLKRENARLKVGDKR